MYDRAKLRDALKARNMTNETLRTGAENAGGDLFSGTVMAAADDYF